MRQQLRLRVLLPLAVLGLLGAGFGAYAFGQAPEPASTPLPATTTAAKPKPGGAVAVKAWAEQANALCVQAEAEVGELPEPGTPKQVLAYLRTAHKVQRANLPAFAALGWPSAEKDAVLALRSLYVRGTELTRSSIEELAADDLDGFLRVVDRGVALDRRWDAAVRRLGANECAGGAASTARKARKAAALEWALVEHRAVVVLFYTPASGLDGTTVLEARSAALDTGAAFLPVNVKANGEVSELAETYEVLEAPAALVFVRGPKLAARFDRFADRETIAQAVENALE